MIRLRPELLGTYGWDYVIRFRENIIVAESDAEGVPAAELVPEHGRVRKLVGVTVTRKKSKVPAVVLVKRKGMKEAWCLATSLTTADANEIVKAYSKRFTIEETFFARRTSATPGGVIACCSSSRSPTRC